MTTSTFRSIFVLSDTYLAIKKQMDMGLPIRYSEELALEFARQLNLHHNQQVTLDKVHEVLIAEFE